MTIYNGANEIAEIVAANTGNSYVSSSKITNPQTKAEWIEYQGTDKGYRGNGIQGGSQANVNTGRGKNNISPDTNA